MHMTVLKTYHTKDTREDPIVPLHPHRDTNNRCGRTSYIVTPRTMEDDEQQQQLPAAVSTTTTGVVDPSLLLSSKRVVYIGHLPNETTTQMLRAAMIPFGEIRSLDMPMDYVKGTHRGFAFVEYDDVEDAHEAIYNMDGAELLGQVIAVSLAQPNQVARLLSQSNANVASGTAASSTTTTTEAIWTSDEWFQQHVSGNTTMDNTNTTGEDATTTTTKKQRQRDAQTLQAT